MSKPIHKQLLAASASLPHLHQLISHNGVLQLKKRAPAELFEYLCQTVVGQQLSNKAAETIWQRIAGFCEEKDKPLFQLLTPRYAEKIRSCGLSQAKLMAMMGLRDAIKQGQLNEDIHTSQDPQLIISEISGLWGFGTWSAEMAALFFFAQPDIWSEKDAALARGLSILSSREHCHQQELLDAVRPYRSYFALHVWRGLDRGNLA